MMSNKSRWRWRACLFLAIVWLAPASGAQVCQTAADMDAGTRPVLEATAKRYFDMASRGDTSALQQNSIAAVAASFGGIESAVKENQPALAGKQATPRPPYLLTAEGSEPLARAEFLCGVFGSSGQTSRSAVFVLTNLPLGRYAVAILDVNGGPASGTAGAQDARAMTLILQQVANDWKLAGFYVRQSELGGHDAQWFAQRAREFKTKGQTWNAWLYFRQTIALATPVDFMSTLATDRLYDEAQSVQPGDLPSPDRPLVVVGQIGSTEQGGVPRQQKPADTPNVAKAAKSYSITQIFPLAVGKDLDVVVKYQASDVSNTAQVFQDNMAVIRGLIAKLPQLREGFEGVVARAVEPSGRYYGSLLMMKDVK